MYNKEKLNQIISEKSVIQRVEQIADEISRSFEGEIPILVSVLNGSFIFTSDLVRAMKIDCEIDFIKVSTYFGQESKGRVDFQKDISIEITNRHIIIVEDIIDSGITINFLKQLKRDEDKIKFCNLNEIVLVEYFDGDNRLSDLDKMLDF